MATQEIDSPVEAREDRLRRKAARKSARADRAEARGRTKRAAALRGKAGVKKAKADKIGGKQDAKDAKQKSRQERRLKKVKGKQEGKAGKKEARKDKRQAAGKKIKAGVKKAVDKKVDKVKGKVKKVKDTVAKVKRKTAAAAGAFKGTSMYGGNKGDLHRIDGHATGKGGKDYEGTSAYDMSVPAKKLEYIQHSAGKYDNAHNIGGPRMSAEKYDMNKAYSHNMKDSARLHYLENALHKDKKGGSKLSKHFARNRKK